ncbi:MAG TPA: hypothetical protein VJS92_15945 [Candidatus Polarisedimenticolaceae bacterium]|nr:hypothetical protein [Candidatus Polarisedimenticolaceae bacterium]
MSGKLLLLALAAGWVGSGAWAGDAIPVRAPAHLSATGLYDLRILPYAPQYPLWSDGAAKARWIYLPERATIDVSDAAAWSFPIGTKFWKEFSFGGRKVETRMLWRAGAEEWIFATYLWDELQTDAVLAPQDGVPDFVEIAPSKHHSIPAVSDCLTCHAAGRTPVLGFNMLQLSDDRDPLAPHAEPLGPGMVTLSSLEAEARLDPARPEWVTDPPRIQAVSPRERAARGYLAANCGGCHNPEGPLARLGLALSHTPGALATAENIAGRFRIPGAELGSTRRLAPGDPAHSSILYRMRSRRPSSQMPPLGTVIADDEAAGLVERWIADDLSPAARGDGSR